MSIATNVSSVSYTGNGTTVYFPFTGKFLSASDLRVSVTTSGVEAVKTLNTHYTVAGVGDDVGGSVTFLTAPANGTTITIQRNTAFTQPTNLVNNGVFDAEVIEDALDRVTLLVQQVKEQADRAVRMPVNETSITSELPSAATRSNTLQGYDASGNPVFHAFDVGSLVVVAPSSINTANIVDAAVTALKLAATLDLSSKTVTLPAASVAASKLAASLDLSSKTLTFGNNQIPGKALAAGSIGFDRLAPSLRATNIAVGFSNPSPDLIMSGAGLSGLNGVWVYDSLYSSRPLYLFPSRTAYTHFIRWDTGTSSWSIYQSAGNVLLYSSTQDVVYPDAVTAWVTEAGGTAPAPNPLSLNTAAVEVVGTVKATSLQGDLSNCTSKRDGSVTFSKFPTHTGQSGIYSASFTAFINSEGSVTIVGGPSNVFQPSGIVVTSRKALFRQSVANAVTGVTDNLNGWTDTVVKLVQSGNNLLALTASGFVYAMGTNHAGQLGQGDTATRPYFVAVKVGASLTCTDIWANSSVEDASGSGSTASSPSFFAKTSTGILYAWGRNDAGQLGIGSTTNATTPAIPTAAWGAKTVSKVVGTRTNTYVLTSDGYCYATGIDTTGQNGTTGAAADVTSFVLMTGTGTTIVATDIFCAGRYDGTTYYGGVWVTIADGTVYGSGYNASYNLGLGNTTSTVVLTANATPVKVSKLYPMGNTGTYCLAVKTDNSFVAWGINTKGQTGTGTSAGTSVQTPTVVSGITLSSSISVTDVLSIGSGATDGTTIVLTSDGKAYSSGYGGEGTRGDGAAADSTTFTRIPINATITAIHAVGYSTVCTTLLADSLGRVWVFGNGSAYQLGNGQTVNAYAPILL